MADIDIRMPEWSGLPLRLVDLGDGGWAPGVALTGSNFEQTINSAIPSKAALMGVSDGANIQAFRGASTYKYKASTNLAGGGAATIWTPAAGKKIRLMGAIVGVTGAGNHILKYDSTVIGAIQLNAQGMTVMDFDQGLLAGAANEALTITNNTAGALSYYVTAWGTEE